MSAENKPISVTIEDGKKEIVNAINGLNLHPTILEMIVKEIYLEIKNIKELTYEREKAEYELMLASNSETTESEV